MRNNIIVMFGLLVGACCFGACAEEDRSTVTMVHGKGIVNGQLEEGFPSAVSIGGSFGDETMSMCTGNLITPKVIISAAHCGDGVPLWLITGAGVAFFGSDILDPDNAIGFDDHIVHPDYEELVSEPGGFLGRFDLSIFVLKEEATVEPTWFRRNEITDDDLDAELTSVGFGVTSGGGDGSGIKRSATLTLDEYDDNFLLSHVATNPNDANICSGDSGGPQFFFTDDHWIQGAVHSWGDVDCLIESGSTRVDIATEWILDQVENVHGTRDVCEINGWYDNGVCDPFCDEPDPDCDETPDGDAGAGDAGDAGGAGLVPPGDGCGCSTSSRPSPISAVFFVLFLAAFLVRGRKRS